jgi:hypothetical protein
MYRVRRSPSKSGNSRSKSRSDGRVKLVVDASFGRKISNRQGLVAPTRHRDLAIAGALPGTGAGTGIGLEGTIAIPTVPTSERIRSRREISISSSG